MLELSLLPNSIQNREKLSKHHETGCSILSRNLHEKNDDTKVGNLMEWKLLAAILWLLNSVVTMTKLLRIEMRTKSTNHEGGSNKSPKRSHFPPEIFENIMNSKSMWRFFLNHQLIKLREISSSALEFRFKINTVNMCMLFSQKLVFLWS